MRNSTANSTDIPLLTKSGMLIIDDFVSLGLIKNNSWMQIGLLSNYQTHISDLQRPLHLTGNWLSLLLPKLLSPYASFFCFWRFSISLCNANLLLESAALSITKKKWLILLVLRNVGTWGTSRGVNKGEKLLFHLYSLNKSMIYSKESFP